MRPKAKPKKSATASCRRLNLRVDATFLKDLKREALERDVSAQVFAYDILCKGFRRIVRREAEPEPATA